MQRRGFLMAASLAAALPRISAAQSGGGQSPAHPPAQTSGPAPSGQPVRLGWVTAQNAPSLAPYIAVTRASLADMNYVEGRNLDIQFRYGDNSIERVPELVADLERRGINVLIAQGAAVRVIADLALKTPVAYVFSGDPVLAGLADSLARPGRNMTGLTFMAAELNAKRLEMLREINPGLRRVAVVGNPEHPGAHIERQICEQAAQQLGLDVRYFSTRNPDELDGALSAIGTYRAEAISLFADGFAVENRRRIIEFGNSLRIPVTSGWPVFAQSGALCTYGPRLTDSYRRLAYYVDRLLKGARPADLPIERPTTFELVVNLKTAKALDIRMPESLLAKADDVIA